MKKTMKRNWLMAMVFALTCTLAGAATLDDVITNAGGVPKAVVGCGKRRENKEWQRRICRRAKGGCYSEVNA